jgi:RNA polymerase sigma-70 factor (ECF subfamily)
MQLFDTPDLVARAQQGNPEAMGILYEQHHQSIFRYLVYRLNDSHAAEDLTSEVFLKMVQFMASYRATNATFRAWLFQVARNLSIDYFRRNHAHPVRTIDEEMEAPRQEHPEDRAEQAFTSQMLQKALAQLGDDQRDVILLRFVEGMPLSEVASTLHRSEDAVKGLQRRALLGLRDLLDHREPEAEDGKLRQYS